MAGLPNFLISTQEDPYWEISLLDTQGAPLSLDGRTFIAIISPATTGSVAGASPAEIKILHFGDGLTLTPPTDGSGDPSIKNTLVHHVSREFAQANFPRGELTADILETTEGTRRTRFIPVRLRYDDPAANREFSNTAAGISFVAGRQPIITSVAVAGQPGRRGSGYITGTLPPQPSDGENGDYWIVERDGQSGLLYGPKEGGEWPSQPSSSLGVGGVADVPGLSGALAAKATLNHVALADVDYVATVNDRQIGFTSLTAPHSVFLPDVDEFPLGEVLFIADECGACSPDRPIYLIPQGQTNDTIAGEPGYTMSNRYQGIGLRRGAANVWILAR